MQRGGGQQVQLQGIPFPYSQREQGASLELFKFENRSESIANWAQENNLGGDKQWGIISQAESKEENLFLSLGFRRVQKTKLKFQNGRVEKIQEETTEPEIGEFHFRRDAGLLELYSIGAKQKSLLLKSLSECFGKEHLSRLYLPKDAMTSLMAEAAEVNSVSLTGLGNPFFNDASLAGADPINSKTYRELSSGGEIKSFKGKFLLQSDSGEALPFSVSLYSSCKLRFFGGQAPIRQGDIEDFAKKVSDIATTSEEATLTAT
ncbi:MAG: hypothetical protein ACREBS_00340 [Nitrososphaerales archaeon]